MKKLNLFFLIALFAALTINSNADVLTVSGIVSENPEVNPVPGHQVMIEIPPSNMLDGYYNEVITNDVGEYFDEIILPEIITQGELFLSTIDCNGEMITEMFYYSPNVMNIIHDFIIYDEPFPDCWAMFDRQPSPNSLLTIMFYDASFFSSDQVPWFWEFGDGSGSEDQNPEHTFGAPRVYPVCLTITTPDCKDAFCQAVWVEGRGGRYCQVYYTWRPMDDLTVEFLNLSTFEPGECVWELDDGQTLWETNPVYNYDQPGVYPVCLTIYCDNCIDVYCADVIVDGIANECYAEFDFQINEALNVQFVDWSYPTPKEWLWDFGDGSTSTEQNPTHQYQEAGVFEVCLTIYNGAINCEDMVCQVVDFGNPGGLNASFVFLQNSTNFFTLYFFDTLTGNPTELMWEFGDGTMSNEQNPVHSFNGPGSFVVCLAIFNENGEAPTYCEEIILDGSFISGIDEPVNNLTVNSVFPNPVHRFVNLEMDSQENVVADIVLINLQGQEVKRCQHGLNRGENQMRVDVSGLAEAIFLPRAMTENSLSTTKMKISK